MDDFFSFIVSLFSWKLQDTLCLIFFPNPLSLSSIQEFPAFSFQLISVDKVKLSKVMVSDPGVIWGHFFFS